MKYYNFVNANTKDDFSAYIEKCQALSFYDTGADAEYGDKLITLSTCEYSQNNGRFVVVAKLIEVNSYEREMFFDYAAESKSKQDKNNIYLLIDVSIYISENNLKKEEICREAEQIAILKNNKGRCCFFTAPLLIYDIIYL